MCSILQRLDYCNSVLAGLPASSTTTDSKRCSPSGSQSGLSGTHYSSITAVTLATSSLQNTVQDRHNDAPHLEQYRSNLLLWLNQFFINTILEINYQWSSRCTTHTYKTGWPCFLYRWSKSLEQSPSLTATNCFRRCFHKTTEDLSLAVRFIVNIRLLTVLTACILLL